MFFQFGARSALLLPFVVPGAVAAVWLLGRALRRGAPADALLALLIALPTVSVAQWMLGYVGWYDSHDGHSTEMFYVPWHLGTALGAGYYLYFRSLTNQEFRWRPLAVHWLPTLLELGLFAAAAACDLRPAVVARAARPAAARFLRHEGAAATVFDGLALPLALLSHGLLLAYGLRMLAEYRRYLDDSFSNPERLRFAGLRQLLLLVLTLGLLYTALNTAFDVSYDAAWNFFALRGILIYRLIVVGVQANYAAATSPLRFGALAVAAVADALPVPGSGAGLELEELGAPAAAERPAVAAGPPAFAAGPRRPPHRCRPSWCPGATSCWR